MPSEFGQIGSATSLRLLDVCTDVRMARWNVGRDRIRGRSEDVPVPADPIHERWRRKNDPPNLERFTSQEAIQDGGIAELYERSRGTGVNATRVSDE